MPTLSEALTIAIDHYRAGRVDLAEEICRRILQVEPKHADTLNLFGVIARQRGQLAVAVESIGRAVASCPSCALYHNNLGNALHESGELGEAVACYRRALELQPDYAEAYSNLGNALLAQAKPAEAATCYQRALALKPDYVEAYNNLGNALIAQEKSDEAVACYRRALELRPDYAQAYNNLGTALHRQGKSREAVACYQRALQWKPDADTFYNQGNALKELGELDAAVASYRRALEFRPGHAQTHNNLGLALHDLGSLDEAIACYQRALQLKPDHVHAYTNWGNALLAQGRTDAAIDRHRQALDMAPNSAEACNNLASALLAQGKPDQAMPYCGRALELKPDFAHAYNNLGTALHGEGQFDSALACFERALQLQPNNARIHSTLLGTLLYRSGVTLREIADADAEFERRQGVPMRAVWREHANLRDPDRPLRLGFVSPDLGQHPVGYFLARVVEDLDRSQCELGYYSNRLLSDSMAARMRATAAFWRDVGSLSDSRLAEQIRADRIDILLDLAGHTAGNRLPVFARKPAPLQITWIGGEGTTGLRAMDYLLADRHLVPPEAEPYCSERVLRMPDSYVCYDPPAEAPEVGPLPALGNGRVTFGSFNNPAKLNPEVIATWGAILRRVPGSRLVLKYRGLDWPAVQARVHCLFQDQGVAADRVELQGVSPRAEYLASYQRVDIALDPFPFGGGLTTCDALWMGVPVVTCPGETFASRHGLSHLSNMGLVDTIAHDGDDYVERAVKLAGDLPRLAAMRAGLRRQMAGSPLCDAPRFAANLIAVLRSVWREWCART